MLPSGAVLNLASFLLLGRTSALTMNIGGVVKDWLLIGLSASVFHSVVTAVNLGGYALAFLGVFWYNLQKIWERSRTEAAATSGSAAAPADASPLLRRPADSCSPRRSSVHELVVHASDSRVSSDDE